MPVVTVDPEAELRDRYTDWWTALARAIGFEMVGSVTALGDDAATTEAVRYQHRQNAVFLVHLSRPALN